MTTLTETMYKVRIGIKLGAITVISLIIFWNIYKFLYKQWLKINPPPPPPPTVYFGVLPKLNWPSTKNQTDLSNFQIKFKISTIRQRQLKNQIGYVLIYLKNRANIWGPQELSQTAASMGFTNKQGRLENDPLWIRFYDNKKITSLDINEVNGYFRIRTKNYSKLNLLNSVFISDNQVTKFLSKWLEKNQYQINDLKIDSFVYYRFLKQKLIKVDNISDAQIVEVNYKRKDINNRPVIFLDNRPVVSFRVIKTSETMKIIRADFNYRPVYFQKPATYPLISPSLSWQYLLAKKGLIIKPPSKQELIVDKVNLGFYDSLSPYKYMVPIYIFSSSKDNFLAISSALPEKWLPLK